MPVIIYISYIFFICFIKKVYRMIQVAFTLLPSQRQTFQRHPDSAKERGGVEGGGSIGGRKG